MKEPPSTVHWTAPFCGILAVLALFGCVSPLPSSPSPVVLSWTFTNVSALQTEKCLEHTISSLNGKVIGTSYQPESDIISAFFPKVAVADGPLYANLLMFHYSNDIVRVRFIPRTRYRSALNETNSIGIESAFSQKLYECLRGN